MQKVIFKDLGAIDYKEAWDYQQHLLDELVAIKRSNRKLEPDHADWQIQKHFLLFCEHTPVYTLGKSGSLDHLLLSEQELSDRSIDFYKINRGGDITFHGKGQVVAYPIFDLEYFFTDVHKYVRSLEEVVIRTLADYGLQGIRKEGFTGVWLDKTDSLPFRKICAIGVHLSRWVTMHGFAFNVNTELNYFDNIVPCGINDADKIVTSLKQELGQSVDLEIIKGKLKYHFQDLFGFVFDESKS